MVCDCQYFPKSHNCHIQPLLICVNHSDSANTFRYGHKLPYLYSFFSNRLSRFFTRNWQKQYIRIHRIAYKSTWCIYSPYAFRHISHRNDPTQNPLRIPRICLSRTNSHRHPPRHPKHYISQNHISTSRLFLSRKERRHHQPNYKRRSRGRSFYHIITRNHIQKPNNDSSLPHSPFHYELETNHFCTHSTTNQRITNRTYRQIT